VKDAIVLLSGSLTLKKEVLQVPLMTVHDDLWSVYVSFPFLSLLHAYGAFGRGERSLIPEQEKP
jgi:hypothetical protein